MPGANYTRQTPNVTGIEVVLINEIFKTLNAKAKYTGYAMKDVFRYGSSVFGNN